MRYDLTRRRFLATLGAACVPAVLPRAAHALHADTHPTPRPGITGNNVLTKAQLADSPKAVPVFDAVRKIPHIIDGIRCHCGCPHPPTFYSLLSCYEGTGMARDCAICQGQGRLAVRLHSEGKTLDEIRSAIDAKFG
jgi:hypothetical protein